MVCSVSIVALGLHPTLQLYTLNYQLLPIDTSGVYSVYCIRSTDATVATSVRVTAVVGYSASRFVTVT